MNSDRYHGFSLSSVCWGYRDIFGKAIEELFDSGVLGEGKEKVSREFFALMKNADKGCFDYVLKEFLGALNPKNRWIMELPGMFSDITILGRDLTKEKLYNGALFFRLLGEGGFGSSPKEVRTLINSVRGLMEYDLDLATSFMKGYSRLCSRLEGDEVNRFIQEGLKAYAENREQGIKYMQVVTKRSENILLGLSRECRLQDVSASLSALVAALVGYEVSIEDLSKLDSDELLERGSNFVCLYKWMYVPLTIRHFPCRSQNRRWYYLLAIIAASLLEEKGFSRIHGHPDYGTFRDLVPGGLVEENLFLLIEYTRIMESIRNRWPGAGRLLDLGLRTEFSELPAAEPLDVLLKDCLEGPGEDQSDAHLAIIRLASQSKSIFDTVRFLLPEQVEAIRKMIPEIEQRRVRVPSFFPDFLYPGQVDIAPEEFMLGDLKAGDDEGEGADKGEEQKDERAVSAASDKHAPAEEVPDKDILPAAYYYDEWSYKQKDYFVKYCALREMPVLTGLSRGAIDMGDEVGRVRQVFERLKPDDVSKERRLPDGENINTDLLVDYLCNRSNQPDVPPLFYEKPLINKRDLAVLILLDVSGSTGDTTDKASVLDVEKKAALVLGEGLNLLGDSFAVCGFSGTGRDKCEYFVFKDFDGEWGGESAERIMSASPRSSTRIGVALRHSGWKMAMLPNKQKLIIIVTDGKPMDGDYDPRTRYAQYDVRKACEENMRHQINTYAISTTENSVADMELMFPRNRYAILTDISRLPVVLPRLYIQLTA